MGQLAPQDLSNGSSGQPSGLTSSLSAGFSDDVSMGNSLTMDSPGPTGFEPNGMQPGNMQNASMQADNATANDAASGDGSPTLADNAATMEPLTSELVAVADQKLQRVRELIRSANWKEMKPAAQAALEQPMSDEQRAQAEALFNLADLASYYRVGIEKAVARLNVGNDFEVTDDFRVIIVETGPDQLVVRFNAKNKSFTFDELPWSLAHKLAGFSMPGDPASEAAKAVYQAISPNANQAYRDQALQWLSEIQGEVEGADATQLAETIRDLFARS
jgi:hypothetical protein